MLVTLLSINVVFWICLTELCRFHAYINYYGITTLQYLQQQEEKRAERQNMPKRVKSKIKIKLHKIQD